jgi:hypothetical protein
MAQTYYKVTIGCSSVNNFFRNRYKRNIWIKAKKIWEQPTKLFIFKHFQDAANFSDLFFVSCIWKCYVKNPKKLNYRASSFGEQEEMYYFWRNYNNKKSLAVYEKAPYGTYCCDAVKLIKKVNTND